MDTVVTAVIVVGIGLLAIAWLLAGRRRKTRPSALEHRRLAGREAEVVVKPPHPAPSAERADPHPAVARAPQAEPPAPDNAADPASAEAAEAPLLLGPALKRPPKPEIAASQARAPRSPAQASAMSIAAALVRHDKREAAPVEKTEAPTAPESVRSVGGDDLTAINGIDHKIAKELNDLGIRYFDQIRDWSPEHAAWVASRLSVSVSSHQRAAWMNESRALTEQSPGSDDDFAGRLQ